MKKASNIVKAITIATILIVLLIFSFQNLEKVQVDFLNFESKEIPLFIILLGVLILGVLIGYLLGLISGSKVSQTKIDKINQKATKQIEKAEQKIISLEQKISSEKTNISNKL